MREMRSLIAGSRVFGRIAIVGWCLLDDEVAAAAQRSGVLAGVAQGVAPGVGDFLTVRGLDVLRRRAPLAALSVGELPPTLDLAGVEGAGVLTAVAVGSLTTPSDSVGRWAAVSEGQVFVGYGAFSRPAFPPGQPYPSAIALGFANDHQLHVVTSHQALQINPDTLEIRPYREWPSGTSLSMVGSFGIIASPGVDSGDVVWSPIDGGDLVALPGVRYPSGAMVAVADFHAAATEDDRLWLTELDRAERSWTKVSFFDRSADVMTATNDHVVFGNKTGVIQHISWDEDARDSLPLIEAQILDGPVRCAAAARHIAVAASSNQVAVMCGGHLVGRFSPTFPNAEGEIRAVGISADEAVLAVSLYPLGLRFWRIDTAPEVRLTQYTADTPEGKDLLGIRPTVEALAAVVVARAVEPPLSIGLFGAWGSGKTFFMRMLERRVAELSSDSHSSGRAQSSLWAWRNVRQVRFNAWHYAAADVWAGLLDHLVRELARPARGVLPIELPEELSALAQQRVRQLAGAEEQVQAAKEELADATTALERAEAAARIEKIKFQEARKSTEKVRATKPAELVTEESRLRLNDALTAAGLPTLGNSIEETIRDIQEARAAWRSSSALGRTLTGRRLFLGLSCVLLLGVLVTVVLERLDVDLAGTFGVMTAGVAAVGAIARWLAAAGRAVESRMKQYDEAEAAARRVEEEVAARMAQAYQNMELARQNVEVKQDQRQQAALRLREAQVRADSVTPGNLLMQYLEARSATDDYRGRLGLIGTVRRDLQVISDGVSRNNQEAAEEPNRPLDDVVNRVVLYIDDLDRCPPEVVVRVLEAVSMLLTFPMFIVVTAVDAHWVSRSLASVYPEMLTGGKVRDGVSPYSYLEKIFQMPVWLDAPSSEAAAAMAQFLLAAPSEADALAGSTVRKAVRGDQPRNPEIASQPGRELDDRGRLPKVALTTSPPAAVVLEPSELSAVAELAPLVARSPRALKRFLNTYRVLKALVGDQDLAVGRLLLALAAGQPGLGERLLVDIARANADETLGDLTRNWPSVDQVHLQDAIPRSLGDWTLLRCADVQPVAVQVRRFVFRLEHRADDESPGVLGDVRGPDT